MQEVLIGLFAIGIGLVFTFFGYKAMRIVFPLWGLIAGFTLGVEMMQALTGNGFLSTTVGVLVGIVLGLIFAVLAYLYYAVAIILFCGLLGYWVGAGLLIWIGVDPGFVSALAGIIVGVIFVLSAFIFRAPKHFLLLFTAVGGSLLMVTGLMLMGNVINQNELQYGAVRAITDQSWIWQLVWLGTAVFGFVSQEVGSAEEEVDIMKAWEA